MLISHASLLGLILQIGGPGRGHPAGMAGRRGARSSSFVP
jgi:hypothetical protein